MGKAPLLDATAQNGVNSSTLSVATWWLQWVLSSLVLQRNEGRALRESGDGLQLLWRADFSGVETSFLGRVVRGSFQRSTNLCVVVVVSRDIEAIDRKFHRLDVRGACNVDVTRRVCRVVVGMGEVLSSSECPNCCIASVIRN